MNIATREILLSFWKVHILHHASEEPVHGQWVLTELRRHGYDISPGTLYPLLHRMERHGWLKCRKVPGRRTAGAEGLPPHRRGPSKALAAGPRATGGAVSGSGRRGATEKVP